MLDSDILSQLKDLFSGLSRDISFVVTGAPGADDTLRMTEFLNDVASVSPRLSVSVSESASGQPAAASFAIFRDGEPTGISFTGIPGGHEFSSLILAVLNADGKGKNLPDAAVRHRIEALRGPVSLRVFVSLTCTNCPDVVQALNVIALYNPAVTSGTVDGAVVEDEVRTLGVSSVPTVYADGEVLAVGRTSLADLLAKLEEKYGSEPAGEFRKEHTGYDVLVAGAGPAGVAAAVYLARKGLRTAVIAGRVGGQVRDTTAIDNLISVPSTTGTRLAADLREHLDAYDIDIFDNRRIVEADFTAPGAKVLRADSGESFTAPRVVIATGARWRRMEVPGEDPHIGKGVAFCTHCDGPFYAGRRVAVIGGGNSGIEAALDLAAICPHVDVFEFMDSLKADSVLQQKVGSAGNITVHLSSQVLEVIGDASSVTGLRVKDRVNGSEKVFDVSGVFVQIGLSPDSSVFAGQVDCNSRGEIVIDGVGRTSVPGVYAAGDVASIPYKQIVIAMGSGATAALALVDDIMRS